MKNAFDFWSQGVANYSDDMMDFRLEFIEASSKSDSDISISWLKGDHGDTFAFDGCKC